MEKDLYREERVSSSNQDDDKENESMHESGSDADTEEDEMRTRSLLKRLHDP